MIELHNTECLAFMKTLPDNSIDAVVTDPPYGMSQHSQADIVAALTAWLAGEDYAHGKKGFMGKAWDSFVPSPTVWKEVLRVLKPGGHILCAASSRTSDLMGISLRLAGFEIRDTVEWLYGSGFPKSANISKQIDKAAGAEREVVGFDKTKHRIVKNHNQTSYSEFRQKDADSKATITAPATEAAKQWEGMGTALKPAHEPFILARKPIEKGLTIVENCLKWGTGGLDIDGCRVGIDLTDKCLRLNSHNHKHKGDTGFLIGYNGIGSKATQDMGYHNSKGRFPANLIHDGSEEVVGLFPETSSHGGGQSSFGGTFGNKKPAAKAFASKGSAARFFYCAKASPSERNKGLDDFEDKKTNDGRKTDIDNAFQRGITERKNHHPTVKPIALMQYLIKLISREGQTVLDPFAGSGTTGVAAKHLNRRFIGCEIDIGYFEIAKARINSTLL